MSRLNHTTMIPRLNPSADADLFSVSAVTAEAKCYPDRILLYAPPKWGKTAWASHAEDVVFLMTKGEDGLLTLKKSGIVASGVRCFPRCAETWQDLLRAINSLISATTRPATLVIDTLNGAEALCHQYVCQKEYGGDWSEKGFMAYQVGYRTASPKEFAKLLDLIDRLRELGTSTICLAHTGSFTHKNHEGADYDVSIPAMHAKTWEVTSPRFDVILSGCFETFVSKQNAKDRKGKATGGERRLIRSQPGAAHVAGGRYPLPATIDCGTTAIEAWENFQKALLGIHDES